MSLPAVVHASTGWVLRDALSAGPATLSFSYGTRPLVPIMGDWDGDGTRTVGSYERGVFNLNNANNNSAADITFTFGDPRGFPVAGDFDGDGTDDVAVYRNGLWQVRLSTGATSSLIYGAGVWPATIPVTGDWDGDGSDGIGTYIYTSATWSLRNAAVSGPGGADAGTFVFGTPNSSYPVTGDWDADGSDTVAVKTATTWSIRNANTAGPAELTFEFGEAHGLPLSWRTPYGAAASAPERWRAICRSAGGVFSQVGTPPNTTLYCYGSSVPDGAQLTETVFHALASMCAEAGGTQHAGVRGDDPYSDIACVVRAPLG